MKHGTLPLVTINLAATFSQELADLTVYVIDVAEGEKYRANAAQELRGLTSSSRSIWLLW